MVRYNAQRDTGDLDRHASFRLDPDVPADCQQTSTDTYRRPDGSEQEYDRGHLVPTNILDHTPEGIAQSNFMTNVVPMARYMNHYGAWRHTEITEECYRDLDELLIFAGVIRGDDAGNDHFLDSHGIATPDRLWKLIIRGRDNVIAWLMPNTDEATADRIDEYLVSVRELEQRTGQSFPMVEEFRKDEVPQVSWQLPIGCDRG